MSSPQRNVLALLAENTFHSSQCHIYKHTRNTRNTTQHNTTLTPLFRVIARVAVACGAVSRR